MTDAQLLVKVETAIEAVLNAQSYSIDGVTYTRASLATLQQMRDKLVDSISKGSIKRVSSWRAPSEG